MNISIYLHPEEINAMEYLQELFQQNVPLSSILIINNRKHVDKSKRIFNERTGNLYLPRDFSALIHGRSIPCYEIDSINNSKTVELIKSLEIDILLLGGGGIVKQTSLIAPRYGILNCHPSDIRKYRGCTNVEWAIYEDYPIYLSCHFITEEIDSGPLVLQQKFNYVEGMTYHELRTQLIFEQAKTMVAGVKKIINHPKQTFSIPPTGEYRNVIKGEQYKAVLTKIANGAYSPAKWN